MSSKVESGEESGEWRAESGCVSRIQKDTLYLTPIMITEPEREPDTQTTTIPFHPPSVPPPYSAFHPNELVNKLPYSIAVSSLHFLFGGNSDTVLSTELNYSAIPYQYSYTPLIKTELLLPLSELLPYLSHPSSSSSSSPAATKVLRTTYLCQPPQASQRVQSSVFL